MPANKDILKPYRENIVLHLLIAVLVGIITGALAVGFRYLLLYATGLVWHDPLDIFGAAGKMSWYIVVLIPVIGGLIVGPLVTFLAPETRGAGVPRVIEAIAGGQGIIRHRTTFYKIICTVISIASGASVGREGPIVHIGSSVGSSIAQLIRMPAEWRRVFLACGAASGIAATFNAPMAGVLFAVEIILIDFEIRYLSHIAISAVTATVISHHFFGNLPAFDVPHYELISYWEILLYCLLGILAGFVAIAFIKGISYTEKVFDRLHIPAYLCPAVGGLLVGLIAINCPHVLGVGYQSVNLVLTAKTAMNTMIIVIIFKLLATSISVGAGFSGGIFAPSLVLGAMLGGVFGSLVNNLFPEITAAFPAYGLVGMAAVVSGATLAPITAIFTIFELTYNFEIILPLMISCIASLVIVQKFHGYSIYETTLLKRGIKIVRGHDVNILRSIPVVDSMEREYESIRENTPLRSLIIKAQESHYPHFLVFNSKNELAGMLSMRDLIGCLANIDELSEIVIAGDIMSKNIHCLTPRDNLETAFEVFEGKHISTMPVVDPLNRKKVLGILKKSNLILAYNKNILKTQTLQSHVKL